MSEFWQARGNRNTDAAQQQIQVLQAALDGPLPLRTLSVAASATIDASARLVRYVGSTATDVLTLPTANALGAGVGQAIVLVNTSTVAISVVPSGADTLNGVTTAYSLLAQSQVLFTADAQGAWWAVAAPVAPPPTPDVQEFTASGTWTKPATVGTYAPKWVRVELVPWGASGGSGRRGTVGSDAGTGGGASGVATWEFPASILGATEAVTFGSQPLGGAPQTADNTNGRDGTDAPDASFGVWLRARGGKKGVGGAAGAVGGAGGQGNAGTGGQGGAATGTNGSAGTGRAGGGGAGGSSGGTGGTGGDGGPDRATTLTGGPGGAAGVAGTTGTNGVVGEVGGGGGGGGGGGQSGGAVGAGANGGRYGAGGGGGGASNNGTNSGKGGDGGPCFGRVTTFYA